MDRVSFTPTPFPVVTKSELATFEKFASTYDPSEVRQDLLALIRARKAIGDALIALSAARRACAANQAVTHQLNNLQAILSGAHENFPLTIMVNGGGHKRPRIFPEHEQL